MIRTINSSQEFSCTLTADFNKELLMDVLGISNDPPKFKVEFPVGKIQRRKHKKRRINKKWAKKYGYKDIIASGILKQINTKDNIERVFDVSNIEYNTR